MSVFIFIQTVLGGSSWLAAIRLCFDLCCVQTDWRLMNLMNITVLKLCEKRLTGCSHSGHAGLKQILFDRASVVGCLCCGWPRYHLDHCKQLNWISINKTYELSVKNVRSKLWIFLKKEWSFDTSYFGQEVIVGYTAILWTGIELFLWTVSPF